MNNQEKFYPESKFGGFTAIDGTIAFFNRINALLDPSFVVLDVGCGRGEYQEDSVFFRKNLRILKGKVSKVIGIDVDQNAQDNPFLDEFYLIKNNAWPVESNSIDLIILDYVLEHISNPDQLFWEIHRVLKNSGYLCIRTTNQWSYIGIAATFIPNKYHSKLTSVVQDARKQEDVFPTVYKCNSIQKIKNIMKKNSIEGVVYGYEPEPAYLSFSKLAYFLGILHQKFAPEFIKPRAISFFPKEV